tara:strand:+ start:17003 stop:17710 length:708 start_codon:yes stop_codon:yes gene_type:complete
MFKDIKNFEYANKMDAYDEDYVIAENDILSFTLYTKNGLQIIDFTAGATSSSSSGNNGGQQNRLRTTGLQYVVEKDGMVNLPLVDRVKISGQTIKELEFFLEKLYSKYYVDPYITVQINNNRVIVSTGGGGSAKVVTLSNRNTTVFEALALAGGINSEGNAKKIKLIRKNDQGEYDVYRIDLSTIEGLSDADITVQANDIVYVQPTRNYVRDAVRELGPYLSLLSSSLLIYSLVR